jgi:hypothetical protein
MAIEILKALQVKQARDVNCQMVAPPHVVRRLARLGHSALPAAAGIRLALGLD